jgi:hypothetical protein
MGAVHGRIVLALPARHNQRKSDSVSATFSSFKCAAGVAVRADVRAFWTYLLYGSVNGFFYVSRGFVARHASTTDHRDGFQLLGVVARDPPTVPLAHSRTVIAGRSRQAVWPNA